MTRSLAREIHIRRIGVDDVFLIGVTFENRPSVSGIEALKVSVHFGGVVECSLELLNSLLR